MYQFLPGPVLKLNKLLHVFQQKWTSAHFINAVGSPACSDNTWFSQDEFSQILVYGPNPAAPTWGASLSIHGNYECLKRGDQTRVPLNVLLTCKLCAPFTSRHGSRSLPTCYAEWEITSQGNSFLITKTVFGKWRKEECKCLETAQEILAAGSL